MPVSALALTAAPSLLQTGAGLAQSIFGGIGAHKAEKQLENTPTPFYNPNKGIQDYYQEALNRYSASPYASMMYQNAQNRIAQSQAGGVSALQDRRSGLAGIGAVVGQGERSLNQAGVQAEQGRRQDFSTLGHAAEMKRADDMTAFQYNKLLPYEKRMSILGAKASGANRTQSAGMQNVFQGLGGLSQLGSSAMQQGLFGGRNGGQQPYLSQGTGLQDAGGTGYSPGNNTDIIMNPNAYSNIQFGG